MATCALHPSGAAVVSECLGTDWPRAKAAVRRHKRLAPHACHIVLGATWRERPRRYGLPSPKRHLRTVPRFWKLDRHPRVSDQQLAGVLTGWVQAHHGDYRTGGRPGTQEPAEPISQHSTVPRGAVGPRSEGGQSAYVYYRARNPYTCPSRLGRAYAASTRPARGRLPRRRDPDLWSFPDGPPAFLQALSVIAWIVWACFRGGLSRAVAVVGGEGQVRSDKQIGPAHGPAADAAVAARLPRRPGFLARHGPPVDSAHSSACSAAVL
jgi:hypothetical protein